MKEWEKLEPGFESGKMAKYLQKHEPVFKELKTKMSAFFENIRDAQKKTNKYDVIMEIIKNVKKMPVIYQFLLYLILSILIFVTPYLLLLLKLTNTMI